MRTPGVTPLIVSRLRSRVAVAGCITLGLAPVTVADAQSSGNGFLFSEPRVTFALRGGLAHASANSDLFDHTRQHLSVDRKDFSGWTLGGDFAVRVAPRIDLMFGAAYSTSEIPSDSRGFEGTDGLPILQTTRFTRAPVAVSLKAFLTPRGENVGSLAWVPARVSPFVGIGGGAMYFSFEQEGEFVDFEDLAIFRDHYYRSAWAPMVQALAGVDVALSPRLGLTTEAKYMYAKGDLIDDKFPANAQDFSGFEPIDLSGFVVTMGLNVRF
jgi:hypothetical protein